MEDSNSGDRVYVLVPSRRVVWLLHHLGTEDIMGAIYCHEAAEVPKELHYAIVTFNQIWIEGDGRSRINPGHGYPGGYQSTASYKAYLNKDEWEAAVILADKQRDNFVAFAVGKLATIKTQVIVEIV